MKIFKNKLGKEFTNVYTYIILLVFFLILISALKFLGTDVAVNENSILDNNSIEYIANLNGIDLSSYEVTEDEIEKSVLIADNSSQGNPKDYALAFQFTKERALPLENIIKSIFSTPQVILIDILRFEVNNWDWLIQILNWFWRLAIILALIYLATSR